MKRVTVTVSQLLTPYECAPDRMDHVELALVHTITCLENSAGPRKPLCYPSALPKCWNTMRNTGNNVGSGDRQTRVVYPSCMVVLHPVAIAVAIHTTWWKRVLAVPLGASERPVEPHS